MSFLDGSDVNFEQAHTVIRICARVLRLEAGGGYE